MNNHLSHLGRIAMQSLPLLRSTVSFVALTALTACNSMGASGFNQNKPETSLQINRSGTLADQNNGILSIARDMEQRGEFAGAIPLYRHLAGRGVDAGKLGLARTLLATGQPAQALVATDNLTNHKSKKHQSGEAWALTGQAYLALGQYREALNAYSRAPGFEGVARGAGIAHAALGDSNAALRSFENDGTPSGRSNAALVRALTGDTYSAVSTLEAMTRSGIATAQDRQNLAVAYMAENRRRDAEAISRVDLDPVTVRETLNFYQTVLSLPVEKRMQAMVTGTVGQAIDREEDGNLLVRNNSENTVAAERVVASISPDPARDETQFASVAPTPVIEETPISEPEPPAPEPIEPTPLVEPEEADPAFVPSVRPEVPDYAPPLLEKEGWAVQIAAYRTIDHLVRGWDILFEQNEILLADIEPRRSEIDFGQRDERPSGFYFRLNAGPLKTLGEARSICNQLMTQGTDCWVRPPEASEGTLPSAKLARSNPNEEE